MKRAPMNDAREEVDQDLDGADLRAPFPWFGGKRRVADLVWAAVGNWKTWSSAAKW